MVARVQLPHRPRPTARIDLPVFLLTTISLAGNQIGDEGARLIAAFLEVNVTLQRLDLCDNQITKEGAARLANALTEKSYNIIGNVGVGKLVYALRQDTTLQEINLGCNLIGDEAAENLAVSIVKNKSLVKIWLNRNGIGDEGTMKLAKDIQSNGTVEEFWFNGNPMSVMAYMKMLKVLDDRNGKSMGR